MRDTGLCRIFCARREQPAARGARDLGSGRCSSLDCGPWVSGAVSAGRAAVPRCAGWVNHGWLGFVSQGGLAVTLAAVLRRAFPEWNVSLEALLVAMIGVHQLAGRSAFNGCYGAPVRLQGRRMLGKRLVRLGDRGYCACWGSGGACSSGTGPTSGAVRRPTLR